MLCEPEALNSNPNTNKNERVLRGGKKEGRRKEEEGGEGRQAGRQTHYSLSGIIAT
jgi:hypothetical protein